MRPMPHEKDINEDLFWWESPDGSRVCAYRIPLAYNIDPPRIGQIGQIKEIAEKVGRDYMAFYGVGNHGGGPTIALIDQISGLNDPELIHSDTDTYFASVDKAGLKTVRDELQHHARGCYSAYTFIKAGNRRCENNLLAAEKLSVMASRLTGVAYPDKKLNKAWKNVLFNQFHDILGGCSVKKAYEDAGYLFGETMSITEQIIHFAMQKIAHRIDTLGEETLPFYKDPKHWKVWQHEVLGTPVVVFNPHAWRVTMPVQINEIVFKVTDSRGREVPFQKVRGDQTNCDDVYHTAFLAEVPSMGYAVYRLFVEHRSEATFEKTLIVSSNTLENERIRVEFSKETGDIVSFYDKKQKRSIINRECRAVILDETLSDTWSHDKVYLGEVCGAFDTPEFTVIEDGNVRATLKVVTHYNQSVLTRYYTLTPDSDTVTVKTQVDFHERHKVLKFTFPTGDENVTAKIPFGTITRDSNAGEEPCGSWIAASGIAVANDSKYGYDTLNGTMRMTVLRSAIYADHFGWRDEHCEYMEQGLHEFSYSVFPYVSAADAERHAEELNFPLRYVVDSFHKGGLPEERSCLSCDSQDVVVTAVKKSEDSDRVIVRLVEMNGKDTPLDITLFNEILHADVSHHEIYTMDEAGKELTLIEWDTCL